MTLRFRGCNSTYRLRYWNFPEKGIIFISEDSCNSTYRLRYWNEERDIFAFTTCFKVLQQYLPFTVLKPPWMAIKALMLAVATVLTVYGIETGLNGNIVPCWGVATVLTVYGIETWKCDISWGRCRGGRCNSTYRLRYWNTIWIHSLSKKISTCCNSTYRLRYWNVSPILLPITATKDVATVLTVYGIETLRSV